MVPKMLELLSSICIYVYNLVVSGNCNNDNKSVNLLIISENNIFITTYVMIQYPYHLPYLY